MGFIGNKPTDVPLTGSDLADGIISEAKLGTDAVSLAKMKAGTDGNIISYDASGNPVAIATGSSGEVLTSGGAGAAPSFAAAAGGRIIQTQSVFGGSASYSTTGSTWHVGGSTRTITMSSTSHKILVIGSANIYIGAGGTFPIVSLNVRRTLAGTATSGVCDTVAFFYDARSIGTGRGQEQTPATCFGLDAPNSTGELTYQLEFQISGMGYSGNAGLEAPLSIILMEVDVS